MLQEHSHHRRRARRRATHSAVVSASRRGVDGQLDRSLLALSRAAMVAGPEEEAGEWNPPNDPAQRHTRRGGLCPSPRPARNQRSAPADALADPWVQLGGGCYGTAGHHAPLNCGNVRKDLAEAGHDAGAETIAWHLRQRGGFRAAGGDDLADLVPPRVHHPKPYKRPHSSWRGSPPGCPTSWQAGLTPVPCPQPTLLARRPPRCPRPHPPQLRCALSCHNPGPAWFALTSTRWGSARESGHAGGAGPVPRWPSRRPARPPHLAAADRHVTRMRRLSRGAPG
jgi:hypothetical protein